jgi:hypothetical protein
MWQPRLVAVAAGYTRERPLVTRMVQVWGSSMVACLPAFIGIPVTGPEWAMGVVYGKAAGYGGYRLRARLWLRLAAGLWLGPP